MKSLLTAREMTVAEIKFILSTAKAFAPYVLKGDSIPLLQNQTVVNLFFENSTRTRMSFELATRKLGGSGLNFVSSSSSVAKGETLIDTAKNIEAMRPH